MMFDPRPFSPAQFQVKFATSQWERTGAHDLRRAVFCREQGLFGDDDRDDIDAVAQPIIAQSMLGFAADRVVGTVRIHEASPGLWWGSRLAVAQDHRKVGALGAALIRVAVCSAHAMGCQIFLAHVQEQNALLFRRLHWQVVEAVELHGRPHLRMQADMAYYPPMATPEVGLVALPRKAA
ncbi:MAG TPA: MSMEG_0567/Sll0786 family nitrogen starvation N-acetyltransferase [Arsenicitalea sp.]|jgi:putative N-acetyltransferase (TIGR04045 family)|nr:MSMEG_0567/Sll0786 family nitrogen starvation N-acetyltransferase [Arsenicitalea sp.]